MATLGLALMMLFGVVHAQVETDVAIDEAAMIQISKGSEAGHLRSPPVRFGGVRVIHAP